MPTLLELFKDRKKDLYDGENVRIESRGQINPPRAAALAASSPNAIGDAIGGQLAGIIGGSANRPSDTIYDDDSVLSKPKSITGVTTAQLRDSVEAGEKYFVKHTPSPIPPLFGKSAPGGSTTAGTIANQAIKAINTLGSKKAITNFANKLKGNTSNDKTYGALNTTGIDGKALKTTKFNSTHKEVYDTTSGKYVVSSLEERKGNFKWDDGNNTLLEIDAYKDIDAYKNSYEASYKDTNQIPILFKKYGNKTIIPFNGIVSGISEDITPEWAGFQYLGSPFKNYRYSGVERSLKFSLKLYYFTSPQRTTMVKKLNYLKSLAFPYDKVSQINSGQSQYAFSPNLVYLTIGDLYKDIFGFIESLSFSIEDNVPWSNFDNSKDTSSYPSIISVSIGMKIIENQKIESGEGTQIYKYNFDGRGDAFINEEREPEAAKPASDNNSNTAGAKPASSTNPDVSSESAYFASF